MNSGRRGLNHFAAKLGAQCSASTCAPGVNVTGLLYGNAHQLLLQFYGAAFIIIYNVIATYIILKVISFITPLRMDEATLKVGDDAVHGETAYAIGTEGE